MWVLYTIPMLICLYCELNSGLDVHQAGIPGYSALLTQNWPYILGLKFSKYPSLF